jgi:hypothetical protein
MHVVVERRTDTEVDATVTDSDGTHQVQLTVGEWPWCGCNKPIGRLNCRHIAAVRQHLKSPDVELEA